MRANAAPALPWPAALLILAVLVRLRYPRRAREMGHGSGAPELGLYQTNEPGTSNPCARGVSGARRNRGSGRGCQSRPAAVLLMSHLHGDHARGAAGGRTGRKVDAPSADARGGGEEKKEEEEEVLLTLLAAQNLLRGRLDCLVNIASRLLSKGIYMRWICQRPILLLRLIDKLLKSASGAHK